MSRFLCGVFCLPFVFSLTNNELGECGRSRIIIHHLVIPSYYVVHSLNSLGDAESSAVTTRFSNTELVTYPPHSCAVHRATGERNGRGRHHRHVQLCYEQHIFQNSLVYQRYRCFIHRSTAARSENCLH